MAGWRIVSAFNFGERDRIFFCMDNLQSYYSASLSGLSVKCTGVWEFCFSAFDPFLVVGHLPTANFIAA